MTLDEIKAIPVQEFVDNKRLVEPGAHLYLWATNRYVRHAWDVAEAWGFTGVCLLVWCKESRGWLPGGAYPSNVEFCLFARCGKLKAHGGASSRWFLWPRTFGPSVREGEKRQSGHSAKPEAFLDLVESVSPGPYLELFARRQRLGWDTWGNEALEHVAMEAAR